MPHSPPAFNAAFGACARADKKVSIAVEKFNPAQQLYRRLGFREVADEGGYWVMEWRVAPDDAPATTVS